MFALFPFAEIREHSVVEKEIEFIQCKHCRFGHGSPARDVNILYKNFHLWEVGHWSRLKNRYPCLGRKNIDLGLVKNKYYNIAKSWTNELQLKV